MIILAVFRSRSETLDFVSLLKKSGVPAQAVNTPREAGIGCGISARFEERFLSRARALLGGRVYPSFKGFMKGTSGNYFYL